MDDVCVFCSGPANGPVHHEGSHEYRTCRTCTELQLFMPADKFLEEIKEICEGRKAPKVPPQCDADTVMRHYNKIYGLSLPPAEDGTLAGI